MYRWKVQTKLRHHSQRLPSDQIHPAGPSLHPGQHLHCPRILGSQAHTSHLCEAGDGRRLAEHDSDQ